jgi:hypothetical protein
MAANLRLGLPVFTARIILLLSVGGAEHTGGVPDLAKEIEGVHKCMTVLQAAEVWCIAGSIRDKLHLRPLLDQLRKFQRNGRITI